jgi:hypothetical protein
LTKKCWHKKPEKRPETNELLAKILTHLEGKLLSTCLEASSLTCHEQARQGRLPVHSSDD